MAKESRERCAPTAGTKNGKVVKNGEVSGGLEKLKSGFSKGRVNTNRAD